MPAAILPPKLDYFVVSPLQKAQRISFSPKESKKEYVLVGSDITRSIRENSIFKENEITIEECSTDVPKYLIDIKNTIESSKEILDLKYNWDDNGAIPINPVIFERVKHFLESYAERIYEVCGKILKMPDIVPVKDGSIDLEWNLENSNFLINFKNTTEEIAFYYGEYKDDDEVVFDTNGQISTGAIKDKFASYLSDLS
jgi:hypothetical protein